MADDHYKTLGVPEDADEGRIRSAHRRLARQYHPDTGPGASEEKFRAVQGAYDVLSDPVRRDAYDRSRRPQAARIRVTRYEPERDCEIQPGHVDLRYLSRRGPQPEPLRSERRSAHSDMETDLLREMLLLLRFFDRF
jgi:curved DNA-binding protein CbpA